MVIIPVQKQPFLEAITFELGLVFCKSCTVGLKKVKELKFYIPLENLKKG